MSNALISPQAIKGELEHMLGQPVTVAMGATTLSFAAQGVHCNVRFEPYALTYTMDEFRERYLEPVAHHIREQLP